MSNSDSEKMFGHTTLNGEDGFVLITVMLVMLLLMGLALAATGSSLLEILITKNNQEYTERLYQAEGAAKELIEKLDARFDNFAIKPEDMDKTTDGAWINKPIDPNSESLTALEHAESMFNTPTLFFNPPGTETKALKNILGATTDIKSLAIYRGPVGGDKASTLNMGSSAGSSGQVYQYEVIGRAKKASGTEAPTAIVNIGYKKRIIR